MSRMVNLPNRNLSGVIRLVLCFLIACLAMHFLLEDAFFLSVFAPSGPASTSTGSFGYDEIEHQDDLVYLASLSMDVSNRAVFHAMQPALPVLEQASLPILPPPKI